MTTLNRSGDGALKVDPYWTRTPPKDTDEDNVLTSLKSKFK